MFKEYKRHFNVVKAFVLHVDIYSLRYILKNEKTFQWMFPFSKAFSNNVVRPKHIFTINENSNKNKKCSSLPIQSKNILYSIISVY